jgi:hypothetical protein
MYDENTERESNNSEYRLKFKRLIEFYSTYNLTIF